MISYVRLQIVMVTLYISRSLCTLLPLTLPRLPIIVTIIEQHFVDGIVAIGNYYYFDLLYLGNFARGEKLNISSFLQHLKRKNHYETMRNCLSKFVEVFDYSCDDFFRCDAQHCWNCLKDIIIVPFTYDSCFIVDKINFI